MQWKPEYTLHQFSIRYTLRAVATLRSLQEVANHLQIAPHTIRKRCSMASAYGWHRANVPLLKTPRIFRHVQIKYVYETLKYCRWNITHAAQVLGITAKSVRLFREKAKSLGYEIGYTPQGENYLQRSKMVDTNKEEK